MTSVAEPKNLPFTPSSTKDLTAERVDELVRLLTDSLVHLKDETGTATVTSRDGKVINQKEWAGWDWNQGVALAVLYNVCWL